MPLLRLPKKHRFYQTRRVVAYRMTARDKREAVGVIFMAIGLPLAIGGGLYSMFEFRHLTSQQLAMKVVIETLAPELTATGIGLILAFLGLIWYFASSNKQGMRNTKNLFGKIWSG